jgi:hypothetical protein
MRPKPSNHIRQKLLNLNLDWYLLHPDESWGGSVASHQFTIASYCSDADFVGFLCVLNNTNYHTLHLPSIIFCTSSNPELPTSGYPQATPSHTTTQTPA